MVLSLTPLPYIIPLLFKYSTLCSLCQSFRNPKAQATAPPAREGFCCEARLRAEQQKGWAGKAFFLWEFSDQKKRIVGSEISHFRAMILLLSFYLLEKNFGVVSNMLGRRFLDSTEQSPVIRTSVISFSIQNGISFLKADRGAGIRVGPGFPISYPVQFGEKGKYLNPRENCGIIKRMKNMVKKNHQAQKINIFLGLRNNSSEARKGGFQICFI